MIRAGCRSREIERKSRAPPILDIIGKRSHRALPLAIAPLSHNRSTIRRATTGPKTATIRPELKECYQQVVQLERAGDLSIN